MRLSRRATLVGAASMAAGGATSAWAQRRDPAIGERL